MHSIASRHQQPAPSPVAVHRLVRKSSSYLSLKSDKDTTPTESTTPLPPSSEFSGPSSHTPKTSYFDAYPRSKPPSIQRSTKAKTRVGSLSRSNTSVTERNRNIWDNSSQEPSYVFPSFDTTEDVEDYTPYPLTPKPHSRTRSTTSSSAKSHRRDTSSVPQLRFSGSSSTQHTETPPRTPIDITASSESLDQFPVVVAAPVAGVETMDALVDGMNGGDDFRSSSRSSRFGIPGHHPLYLPPLPTPPPGVVLGGGKPRRSKPRPKSIPSDSSASDEGEEAVSAPSRRRRTRQSSSRTTSSTGTGSSLPSSAAPTPEQRATPPPKAIADGIPRKIGLVEMRKTVVPSISEIIRTYAPQELRNKPPPSRASSVYVHSHAGSHTVIEERDSEQEALNQADEVDIVSRSSIDSVADEVQRTLRVQAIVKSPPPPLPPPPSTVPPSSFPKRHSIMSDNASICSPRSDPGGASSSIHSSAASFVQPPSPFESTTFLASLKPPSPSQAVAQYLRSARLTTLLKLTRAPHASQDTPLRVSLSDLGSSTGHPVVVFLGLGCVRHIMGLYDEMAECLGLRLITIDRWGLGKTDSRSKSSKGIVQWAAIVEEVLDLLHIEQCSIMAHSAGAPYALSFANKVPHRIVGDICLLAPWVGGGEGGYKWLKYVPNGILKTAQAAEWRLQAWMIGKPPTISYQGIGYTAQTPSTKSSPNRSATSPPPPESVYPHSNSNDRKARSRPSIGSSSFSEYDDLRDFEGRFESHSTLEAAMPSSPTKGSAKGNGTHVPKRKSSRGFLERLKGGGSSNATGSEEKSGPGKKLKALRSMGSLKGKSLTSTKKSSGPPSPALPPSVPLEVGLGLGDLNWTKPTGSDASFNGSLTGMSADRHSIQDNHPGSASTSNGATGASASNGGNSGGSGGIMYIPGGGRRATGRRSISFSSPKSPMSAPSSPVPSSTGSSFAPGIGPGSAYQAALGNALIAASHAESAKGMHNDLLQILNHEGHSWGFTYSSYPHNVKVWYGDKDEKIAENAVRWMERNMGEDRCSVKVVKGADHGLMYRSSVVVEVLEQILSYWKHRQVDNY